MLVIDKFMFFLMEREEDMNIFFIIQYGNIIFIFIKYNSLYLVVIFKKNVNVIMVFVFFYKLVQVGIKWQYFLFFILINEVLFCYE